MKIVEKFEKFSLTAQETSEFSRSVCLFDSGIGGLSVLFALRKKFPRLKFVYYGDNERAPYGNLPNEIVSRYVYEAVEELKRFSPKALVLACSTASLVCARALQRICAFPVLGTYPPLLSARTTRGEGIVFLTRASYSSTEFSALLCRAKRLCPHSKFVVYPCDTLAGKIEDTFASAPAEYYAAELPVRPYAFVVLGCTHYALVKSAFSKTYGCPVFDASEVVCSKLSRVLSERSLRKIVPPLQNGEPLGDVPPIFNHSRKETPRLCSSDGKVLFIGSGGAKNRTFYEHSFVVKNGEKG